MVTFSGMIVRSFKALSQETAVEAGIVIFLHARVLDASADDGRYAYPAIISTSTGMAITYTWNRKSIGFWMGSVEQIPEERV